MHRLEASQGCFRFQVVQAAVSAVAGGWGMQPLVLMPRCLQVWTLSAAALQTASCTGQARQTLIQNQLLHMLSSIAVRLWAPRTCSGQGWQA